jgi:hypothetical protein
VIGPARRDRAQGVVDAALERLRAAGVEVPEPWDVRKLCSDLASWRERPIHLVPGSRFGWWHDHLWIAGQNADFIVWADRSSALHQQHGIVHEIGHLVLGHTGVPVSPGLTHLRNALHARAGYDHPDEIHAECFATTIGVRAFARRIHLPGKLGPDDAEAVERLAAALGFGRVTA